MPSWIMYSSRGGLLAALMVQLPDSSNLARRFTFSAQFNDKPQCVFTLNDKPANGSGLYRLSSVLRLTDKTCWTEEMLFTISSSPLVYYSLWDYPPAYICVSCKTCRVSKRSWNRIARDDTRRHLSAIYIEERLSCFRIDTDALLCFFLGVAKLLTVTGCRKCLWMTWFMSTTYIVEEWTNGNRWAIF